jgi:hypothetical protein
MRRASLKTFLAMCTVLLLAPLGAFADTLELKDGRVLSGRFMGGTQAQVRFDVNGQLQTFSVNDVVAVTFTGNYSAAPQSVAPVPAPATAPAPDSTPAPAPVPADVPQSSTGSRIEVPAGTQLLVRMIDSVDSSKTHVGDRFRASLETDLYADNALVARKGTDVYGRLSESQAAGHIAGSSELKLELTELVIGGRTYPLVTGEYQLKGKGRGEDTAKKVGIGAVGGAILGAIVGGGKGAAIGTGVGAAAGGTVQILTRGEQVRVPSEALLEFRLDQPLRIDTSQ